MILARRPGETASPGPRQFCRRKGAKKMLLKQFNFKTEVLDSTEPVLVDFWAEWCGPCRAMNPTIESLAKHFKVVKVNVDTNQSLAGRYQVSSIPALMIFKNGQIMAQHLGITPEATLRAELEEVRDC
jgi:thioredoxin 1